MGEGAIHVVAAELAVSAGGANLKDAVVEHEDRDVERAAAEVVDCEGAVSLLLEPVRERGRRRLVEQAQDFQPGEARGVLGGLPLRVIEVGWHRDDRPADVPELVLGLSLERAKDLCADLDRRDDAVPRTRKRTVFDSPGFGSTNS